MNISEYETYWYNYYKELNINFFEYSDYNKLKTTNDTHLIVVDHLNGFDINGHNQILEQLNKEIDNPLSKFHVYFLQKNILC